MHSTTPLIYSLNCQFHRLYDKLLSTVEYLNSENMTWCSTSRTCWAEPVTYLHITSLVPCYFFGWICAWMWKLFQSYFSRISIHLSWIKPAAWLYIVIAVVIGCVISHCYLS